MIIYSIIVCYNPQIDCVSELCFKLEESGSKIILVDNSRTSILSNSNTLAKYKVLSQLENVGIAKAQNLGIKYALENNADFITFFDQDSEIHTGFLDLLLAVLTPGIPCVSSPVFFDKNRGFEFPSYRLNMYGMPRKIFSASNGNPYPTDIVISSGTAATAITFKIVGLMDEDFFIDFVDTEWCLRCKAKRVPIWAVPKARMYHAVGERSINFGLIRAFVHSPTRSYYKIRNSLIFIRKPSVPFLLGLKEFLSAIFHHSIMFFFLDNKKEYLRNYFLAILHGFKGLVGKKPN